jgi:hypothetical protein
MSPLMRNLQIVAIAYLPMWRVKQTSTAGRRVIRSACRSRPELRHIYCHGPGGSHRTGWSTEVAAASATGIKN